MQCAHGNYNARLMRDEIDSKSAFTSIILFHYYLPVFTCSVFTLHNRKLDKMIPFPMKTWLYNCRSSNAQWPQRTSLLPQRIAPCYRSSPTEHISYSDIVVHHITLYVYNKSQCDMTTVTIFISIKFIPGKNMYKYIKINKKEYIRIM